MGKKKVLSEEMLRRLVLPAGAQVLGIVTQMLGYDRLRVKSTDGYDRLCRIRGKMKRRVWIRVNDVVLVDPWDFQFETRGDIVWRYTKGQAESLKAKGYLKFQ